MNFQDVSILRIPEGNVRTIHDKNSRLLWGSVGYAVSFDSNATQSGAPTPNSPQPISVVTGEQVVMIDGSGDSQEFPISLGTIELCKIGTYQDRIYKGGEKWYLEKQVAYLQLTGAESGYIARSNTSTTHSKFRIASNVLSGNIATTTSIMCSHFVANDGANDAGYSQNAICGSVASGYRRMLWFSVENSIATTVEEFQTWVTNNRPYLYYALATPTTTEITDQALIAQLEAVYDWVRRYGYSTSVTGDLPVIINRTALPTV